MLIGHAKPILQLQIYHTTLLLGTESKTISGWLVLTRLILFPALQGEEAHQCTSCISNKLLDYLLFVLHQC